MLETVVQGRELSAILIADVHGYTRLMARDEEHTSRRVARAVGLIKSLAGDYGGEIRNVAGDSVLALFRSASRCVKFAVEMQREFRNDSVWSSQSDPIAFRIGINLGEVREDPEGVRGHGVNVASRIQELSDPGGICISASVREFTRDIKGIRLRSLGRPQLKNIEEEIEVFSVADNGAEQDRPGVRMRSDAPAVRVPESSIAVLQLENLSGEPQNAHICNGVTGDIISNLTRFHDLHVIAQRSSSLFQSRNSSPSEIGARLGVRYLVDGGFQRSGSTVRFQFQLIDAMSGRSIWSDRFDGDLGDIFTFQDELTTVVASRLSIEVGTAELHRVASSAPADLQAYGLILRGKHVYEHRQRESNLHARRLFEQAVEVDPHYARSYVGISRTLSDAWRFNWANPPEPSLNEALKQAEVAVRLAPGDARGYAALGSACLYKRFHDESLAAYERALEANPNDADVLAEMGHSVCVNGNTERAVALIKRAMRLNPYYPDWYLWHLGEAYFDLCDYEQAIRTLKQMHDKTEAYRMLAASNAHLGRMDEARECARLLLLTHPEFTLAHWTNVPPDRNPEPRERLIDGLKKAGIE
jgi:TolB-like protein/class 3 adenylate cyclase/Tfp pilus assembly protein PilF